MVEFSPLNGFSIIGTCIDNLFPGQPRDTQKPDPFLSRPDDYKFIIFERIVRHGVDISPLEQSPTTEAVLDVLRKLQSAIKGDSSVVNASIGFSFDERSLDSAFIKVVQKKLEEAAESGNLTFF